MGGFFALYIYLISFNLLFIIQRMEPVNLPKKEKGACCYQNIQEEVVVKLVFSSALLFADVLFSIILCNTEINA